MISDSPRGQRAMTAVRGVAVLVSVLGAAYFAFGAQTEAQTAQHVVKMTSANRFGPQKVTIKVGETVEWQNVSRARHTVTANRSLAKDPAHVTLPEGAKPFDSGMIGPGESWRYTFERPGTYRYFCIPHEQLGMVGEIEVR